MAGLESKAWINLDKARILILDDHAEGANILVQIVMGFGARHITRSHSVAEAKEIVNNTEVHLILVNANLRDASALEFIHWLRHAKLQHNSFTPILLVTGHAQRSRVERARDCGANLIVAKPVSPLAVLERIISISRDKRPFVNCQNYTGPDRRFHDLGPPADMPGRRRDDPPEATASEFGPQ